MLTDTQRLDLLDRLIFDAGDGLDIKRGTMFTGITQHQPVKNIREAIDLIDEFFAKPARRCWNCGIAAVSLSVYRVLPAPSWPASMEVSNGV